MLKLDRMMKTATNMRKENLLFYLNLDKEMSHEETSTWMMNERFKGQLDLQE